MGDFNIPAKIDLEIVQLPQEYTYCFKHFAFGVVYDMQDLYSLSRATERTYVFI
jgi:hypothetical protein